MANTKVHEGRAVKSIREMLKVKQEVLADALGMSQQSVSLLEQRESLDPETKEIIAKTLKVPIEAIENFNEEAAVQIMLNTFNDNAILNGYNHYPTFNPVDKLVDVYEKWLKEKDDEIRKCREEIEQLKKEVKKK